MIDYCSSVEASMAAKPNNIGFNIQIKINLSLVRFFFYFIYTMRAIMQVWALLIRIYDLYE